MFHGGGGRGAGCHDGSNALYLRGSLVIGAHARLAAVEQVAGKGVCSACLDDDKSGHGPCGRVRRFNARRDESVNRRQLAAHRGRRGESGGKPKDEQDDVGTPKRDRRRQMAAACARRRQARGRGACQTVLAGFSVLGLVRRLGRGHLEDIPGCHRRLRCLLEARPVVSRIVRAFERRGLLQRQARQGMGMEGGWQAGGSALRSLATHPAMRGRRLGTGPSKRAGQD